MSPLAQILGWLAFGVAIFAGAVAIGTLVRNGRERRIRRQIGSFLHPRRRRP